MTRPTRRSPREESDTRGASTAISHVLALGITTILIAGLLISANTFVTGKQQSTAQDQLETIGSSLASELERADRLARMGGNITVRSKQPQTTSSGSYTASVENGTECTDASFVDTQSCLVLTTGGGSVREVVALKNETRLSLSRNGSQFVIEATSRDVETAEREVSLYSGIAIGKGIERGNTDLTGDAIEERGYLSGDIQYTRDGTAVDVPGDGTGRKSGVKFTVRNGFPDDATITHVTVYPETDSIDGLDEGGDGSGNYTSEIYISASGDDGSETGDFDLPKNVDLDDNATIDGNGGTAVFTLYEFQDGGTPASMDGENVTIIIDYVLEGGTETYGSDRFTVDLDDNDNDPPTAAFTPNPSSPSPSESVTFDAGPSSDSDGSIVDYHWEFPDGSTDSGEVVTESFPTSGSYDVTLTVTDNNGSARSYTKTVSVGNVVFAINAGGNKYTASSGVVYEADSDSKTAYGDGSTTDTGEDISGTSDDPLYDSERYASGNDFQYNVGSLSSPLPAGEYRVTLKFAEVWFGPDNGGDDTPDDERKFDVFINGTQVEDDYEIYDEAGAVNASVDESYTVTVTDGVLEIRFADGSIENAKVGAIKVEKLSTAKRLTWESASDWDDATSEVAVVHESHGDHQADKVELGYPSGKAGQTRWDAEPVAYWSLDDDATDVSGEGNDGTLQGSVDDTGGGLAGTDAYDFDGSDDYVDVNQVAGDLDGAEFTWSAWVRTTEGDKDAIVVANTDSGDNRVLLFARNDLAAAHEKRGGPSEWAKGSTTITDDQWHHVAVVRSDGPGSSPDRGKLYVDGTEEADFQWETGSVDDDDRLQVGMDYDGASEGDHFDGVIDEVRIYDEVLSADQVQNLSAVGRSGRLVTKVKTAGGTMTASDLTLTYDANVNGGRIEVKVVADDGTESDWLTLNSNGDGTTEYDVPEGSLSDDSDYRLVVKLVSNDEGKTPQLDEITLEDD